MALPILFKIIRNAFRTNASTFFARDIPRGILNQDDIVRHMLQRGTSFGEADLRGSILLYEQVVMDLVAEGYHVNTPLFNARPTIKGSFDSLSDAFDPARHKPEVSLSQGSGFVRRMKTATAQRTQGVELKPIILQFRDFNSGTTNQNLTSGGIGELYGEQLHYEAAEADNGIFFIELETGAQTRATVVSTIGPKKLVFLIPQLKPAQYRIEVRKSYLASKTIRKGILEPIVTCNKS